MRCRGQDSNLRHANYDRAPQFRLSAAWVRQMALNREVERRFFRSVPAGCV